MNRKIQNLLGGGFLVALVVNRIIPMNTNIPTKEQVYMFALTIAIFLFNQKSIITDENEVVVRTNKKKYYVQLSAIYIQLLLLVNSFYIPTNIIDWIASIATLVSLVYAMIRR